jgi:hypothetical protein
MQQPGVGSGGQHAPPSGAAPPPLELELELELLAPPVGGLGSCVATEPPHAVRRAATIKDARTAMPVREQDAFLTETAENKRDPRAATMPRCAARGDRLTEVPWRM